MNQAAIAVLGTGRVGLTLARALVLSGTSVRLLGRTARSAPAGLPAIESDWAGALSATGVLLVAVPDDALASAAEQIASLGVIGAGHVVLHTSGLHGKSELGALHASGAALGSFHPLQAFATEQEGAELLRGVPAVVEGDARAVLVAKELAAALGMGLALELSPGGKASYHAAAVVASNYLVVLADLAERLAREAGAGDAARQLFQPIMQQTLLSIATQGPAAALTGPVRRGDVGTVAAHLAVLRGNDRATYVALGREAIELARRGGLGSAPVAALTALFDSAAGSDP